MGEPASRLSVIIVNWNAGEWLRSCVSSAFAAVAGMRAEIWLVDNASSDGSAELAAKAYPALSVILNDRNLGFARAVNQALSQASGEYVLLLNPDAKIDGGALGRLLEVMRRDPRIGIAGCPSVNHRGRCVPGYETSFPGQRGMSLPQKTGEGQNAAWVSGACLLARRAMIDEIGPLDPGFFMYYEDVDWCYRAHTAGWRVVTLPDVAVRHELGGSSGHVPPAESARRAASSRLRFYQKHYSRRRARWLTLRMFASTVLRLSLQLVPCVFSSSAREKRKLECVRLRAVLAKPAAKEGDASTQPGDKSLPN